VKKNAGLLLIILLILIPLNASAAVKAGSICSKLGQSATVSGQKYTCIKSAKKLVWNKGVAIPKPKATPTPSAVQTPVPIPTPTPTPTISPSPTPTAEPAAPTTFADLLQNYRGIPAAVWNEAQTLASQGSVKSSFTISIGPNTKLQSGLEDPIYYLERASKLWSGFTQSKETKVFLFSFPDLAWAQQRNRELGGSWFVPEDLAGNCTSNISCGAFGGSYKGQGQLFIGVPIREYQRFNLGFVRGNYGHEFTHSVQYAQFANQPTINGYSLLPCWFSEGQPQVPGQALGFETLKDYKLSRETWFSQPAGQLGDYSEASILRFFSLAGVSRDGACNASIRSRIYDVGYMAVEALASVKGIHSTMDLVVGMAQGLTFEDSFKKIYGISWSEAAPILAKVVSAEFTNP